MVIWVDQALCAGCGACVGACSAGAIRLVDQRAVVDEALCVPCAACAAACPNGAIDLLPLPVQSAVTAVPPASDLQPATAQLPAAQPEPVSLARSLVSLTGTALACLGRELAPRLAEVLVALLERRLTQPAADPPAPLSTSRSRALPGRRERKQARRRRRAQW
jgi:Fe-S-cluster-containing hydrogenase component 2